MAHTWREFELLVARIERVLVPHGAVVTSPDRIPDKVTGEPREVDASIRYRVGSAPILITVECRDREAVQDDTWLEQLVTKRQKIGADKTIVVSSSGFTAPAIKDAAFQGIELRQIDELTDAEIRAWVPVASVESWLYRPSLTSISTACYSLQGEDGGRLHPSVVAACEAEGANAPVIVKQDTGELLSINDVFNRALPQLAAGGLYKSVVPGITTSSQIILNIPKGLLSILTEEGARDLARLILGVDVTVEVTEQPADRSFVYKDPKKPILYGREAKTHIAGTTFIVSMYREPGSDILGVTIQTEKNK